MPSVNELLNRVARVPIDCIVLNSYWLFILSSLSANRQIGLHKDSHKYTGFHTDFGSYVYLSFPMELKCASASAQRLTDMLLRRIHKFAASLQDDFIIHSKIFEQHLDHLRVTKWPSNRNRLRQAGLTANRKKCFLASNEIEILGHTILNGKIMPGESKTKAVKECPEPKTKKQLKSFLGVCNIFRGYIDHYAQKAYPLTSILGRSSPNRLIWGFRWKFFEG